VYGLVPNLTHFNVHGQYVHGPPNV
jgi:hypothetical protein